MNRHFTLRGAVAMALLAAGTLAAAGQTVIDLDRGGTVRGKDLDDYKEEQGYQERLRTDSVEYVDHLRRAFNALHEDSIDEAERLFTLALKKRPDAPGNYIVRYNLGRIDLSRNRYRSAITYFDQVLKQRPDLHEVRYDRAVCYMEINSLQAAQADCDLVLEETKDGALKIRALFLKAAIQMRNHQAEEAKITLEAILRLEPGNEGAALLLAAAYEQMGQTQESLNQLNTLVAAHPKSVDGLLARAELEERLKMDELARADYDAAILLQPKEAELYIRRARLLLRMEEKEAARKDLEQAEALGYPREVLNSLYQASRK